MSGTFDLKQTLYRNSSFISFVRIFPSGPKACLLKLLVLAVLLLSGELAGAVSTRVVAIVNGRAISEYQIEQRVKLLRVLMPVQGSDRQQKKAALQDLINDELKNQETKKFKITLSHKQVDKMIAESEDLKNLADRLQKQGLSERLVKDYIITRMTWRRIISMRYDRPEPNDAQVKARFSQIKAEISKQASAQAVTLYKLLPIMLPIDRQATGELTQEVARSRLIEATRIAKRFKSCRSARNATRGVFNVKIGKLISADPEKMSKQMRQTLDRAGTGSAFVMGVAPDKSSVQIMAFCDRERVTPKPPAITREFVKRRLQDQQFENLSNSYLRDLRKSAFIEYKDASLRK